MTSSLAQLWEEAASFDPTLQVPAKYLSALARKRISVQSYTRSKLFSQMAQGQISLFNNFPVRIKKVNETLPNIIKMGFPVLERARTQTGPSRTLRKLKVQEVIRRWEGGRAVVGVTDLHFRGTKFEKALDCTALSDFDILCTDAELIYYIEMMTLVIASKGNYTDSHADDCDGSNHCFIGRKLWLAWDRIEGWDKGFGDVDRDCVSERAAFDIRAFLSLPSSCWFVVGPDETLFLPGSLAHKVITLEPYIGIGGFHVALPSYVWGLRRWILYDTLDVHEKGLLPKIHKAIIGKLQELRKGSKSIKEHWGLSHMQQSILKWKRSERVQTRKLLSDNSIFAQFLQVASSV